MVGIDISTQTYHYRAWFQHPKKSENKTHDIGWILMRWRTFNRSIVRLSGFSCDPIALSYNTRVHFTIVAYRRKIYRNIQCVLIVQQSLLIMSNLCNYFQQQFTNHTFYIFILGRTNILSILLVHQL